MQRINAQGIAEILKDAQTMDGKDITVIPYSDQNRLLYHLGAATAFDFARQALAQNRGQAVTAMLLIAASTYGFLETQSVPMPGELIAIGIRAKQLCDERQLPLPFPCVVPGFKRYYYFGLIAGCMDAFAVLDSPNMTTPEQELRQLAVGALKKVKIGVIPTEAKFGKN